MSQKPLRILVMSSWSFNEPLTHSYLLPYVRIIVSLLPPGSKVWLQTSEKAHLKPDDSALAGIMSSLEKEGILWLPYDYVPFGLKAIIKYVGWIWKLRGLVRKENIGYLHPFAPGAGTTAVFVQMFSSVKVVMDSWEPHAESMVESGVWSRSSLAFRVMWWAEKRLARRADYLIAASKRMPDYAREKWGVVRNDIGFRPACIDLDFMNPQRFDRDEERRKAGLEDKFVCVCVGKLEGMYMGEEAFRFFSTCLDCGEENFHVVLLSETEEEKVRKLAEDIGFPSDAYTLRNVPYSEVPRYLAMANFAFNPQKPIPSKRYGTPVKDGEYWAMGLPIAIHDHISDDSDIVKEERVGVILGDLSHIDNIRVLREMILLCAAPETAKRCRHAAMKYRNFEIAEHAYRSIYLEQ